MSTEYRNDNVWVEGERKRTFNHQSVFGNDRDNTNKREHQYCVCLLVYCMELVDNNRS